MDDDNSGTISLGELKRTCKSLKIKINDQEAFQLMRLMDRNSNGYIDFDDFVNLLAEKCKEELTPAEINTFFDRYDEGNQKIIFNYFFIYFF